MSPSTQIIQVFIDRLVGDFVLGTTEALYEAPRQRAWQVATLGLSTI